MGGGSSSFAKRCFWRNQGFDLAFVCIAFYGPGLCIIYLHVQETVERYFSLAVTWTTSTGFGFPTTGKIGHRAGGFPATKPTSSWHLADD